MLLQKGCIFQSLWFNGIVTVVAVDEANNDMEVSISSNEAGTWSEHWNLQHTIWVFENRDYFNLKQPLFQTAHMPCLATLVITRLSSERLQEH